MVHGKETKSLDFGGSDSEFLGSFSAWYSDVLHEVKPITAGHRLCIVYNLVKLGGGPPPAAAVPMQIQRQLGRAARQWGREKNPDNKLIIVTEHLYTPASMKNKNGLNFKSTDDRLVNRLTSAIRAGVPLEWTTGVLTRRETGTGCGYDYYGRYGGGDFDWEETFEDDIELEADGLGTLYVVRGQVMPIKRGRE